MVGKLIKSFHFFAKSFWILSLKNEWEFNGFLNENYRYLKPINLQNIFPSNPEH
jgi:hypothetical protein